MPENLDGEINMSASRVNSDPTSAASTINMVIEVKDEYVDIHDENDACMRTIISSFTFGDLTPKNNPQLYISGKQIVFHLNDLDNISINLSSDDLAKYNVSKDQLLTQCAAESILKLLYPNDCVQKDIVIFQCRTGNLWEENFNISRLIPIFLKPNLSGIVPINFREGLISRAYAYLSEKRLCLFLNPLTQAQENKIKSVLLQKLVEQKDDPNFTETADNSPKPAAKTQG